MSKCRPVYIPAKVMESTTGKAYHAAIDSAVPSLSLDNLAKLAGAEHTDLFQWMCITDAHKSNKMCVAKAELEIPRALVDGRVCDLNQFNLGIKGPIKEYNILNPLFSLFNSFQFERNQLAITQASCKLLQKMKICRDVPSPAGAVEYSEWLCGETMCRHLGEEALPARLSKFRCLHAKVFNGRLWLPEMEHYCHDPVTGRPCHEKDEDVVTDAIACLSFAFAEIFDSGRKPSDKDFFRTMSYARP